MTDLFLFGCVIIMGMLAQHYYADRERLREEVADLERWIDEIIEELEKGTDA